MVRPLLHSLSLLGLMRCPVRVRSKCCPVQLHQILVASIQLEKSAHHSITCRSVVKHPSHTTGQALPSASKSIRFVWRLPYIPHCITLQRVDAVSACMSVGMQMVELPHGADGLSWIISQQPQQLLLIPGLQAASITAAAAGDQEALSYLRFVAQFAAAHRSMLNLSELDTCCLLAAELIPADGQVAFDIELSGSSPEIRDAFYGRQRCTKELLSKAVQQGQLAALQWIRALCHQIHGDDKGLMEHAARRGSVELMMFLSSGSRPAPWDEDVLEQAIKHPSCLQWLLSRPRPHPCYSDILQQAAKHESLEALKVLHAGKLPSDMWNARVCSSAAAHPNGLCML